MWRALSISVSSASWATAATLSGRAASSLRTICRASAQRGRGQRLGHLLLHRVELAADGLHQLADLQRRLVGEALLESFERDQAVAVAVLVARLARLAHQLGLLLDRIDRRRLGSAAPRALGAAGPAPERSPGAQAANELSSSRGMKRA